MILRLSFSFFVLLLLISCGRPDIICTPSYQKSKHAINSVHYISHLPKHGSLIIFDNKNIAQFDENILEMSNAVESFLEKGNDFDKIESYSFRYYVRAELKGDLYSCADGRKFFRSHYMKILSVHIMSDQEYRGLMDSIISKQRKDRGRNAEQ
jgi:hypothetical protein